MEVVRLAHLDDIGSLAEAARGEGFRFLDRLRREWEDGSNRFEAPGEVLFGAYVDGVLVGTGGLTRQGSSLGRVRRVYVHPEFRRRGIAGALMAAVLEFGRDWYSELVLYTETSEAARLYEGLGFVAEDPEGPDHATHRLDLRLTD